MSKTSMKPDDAPAGDTPPAAPAPAAPAPAVSGDVLAGIQQQIADMQTNHAKEVADLKHALSQRSVSHTADELDQLVRARVQAAMGQVPPPNVNLSETPEQVMARVRREEQKRIADRQTIEDWLLAGPNQYTVTKSNEPRGTRTVGGHSADEAEAKYRRYFGITATVDPTIRITADLIAPPVKS